MLSMFLDTSSDTLLISFIEEKDSIKHELTRRTLTGRRTHAEQLVPLIQDALTECHLEVKDFDRIVCGIGPGSYTGLRVSLAVAKMFSWTLNIPLYTVSSLDIIASGYFKEANTYIIKEKAKTDWVYAKVVSSDGKTLSVLEKDSFITTSDYEHMANKYPNAKLITDGEWDFDCTFDLVQTEVKDIHNCVPEYLREQVI